MHDKANNELRHHKQPKQSATETISYLKSIKQQDPDGFHMVLRSLKSHFEDIDEKTLEDYFSLVAEGFEYTYQTYGETCIPRGHLGITGEVNDSKNSFCFVSDIDGEEYEKIAVTTSMLAGICINLQNAPTKKLKTTDHLATLGYQTTIAGSVVLLTVEESYHCYQYRNNLDHINDNDRLETASNRIHPTEAAIPAVLKKFIESGNFKHPLYKI